MLQEVKEMSVAALESLNPFEVREVLQDSKITLKTVFRGLNPFEVREVLQANKQQQKLQRQVSIPLKSGRCCK